MSTNSLFTDVRSYIRRYAVIEDDQLDVVTTWSLHTWLFSPACTNPVSTPYLYIAAEKGAGKTLLGQDVLGTIVRAPMATVGITGPSLIRLVGGHDDDSDSDDSEPVTAAPTLTIDEVDALYSGAKDEVLRMMLNAGYRRGGVVPRVVGKSVVNYSAFCPKLLMGIDNGHLPDTVLDRSIRIDLHVATPDEMATVEPFYHFDVEDEAAELSERMATWARENSQTVSDYRPAPIEGLRPRQWEIARSLVQVAKMIGNEKRIREALFTLLTSHVAPESVTVRMFRSIATLFDETQTDRLSTEAILQRLTRDGVSVPGNSGKGLGAVLGPQGVKGGVIRFTNGNSETKPARGYYRSAFDSAFARYLPKAEEK